MRRIISANVMTVLTVALLALAFLSLGLLALALLAAWCYIGGRCCAGCSRHCHNLPKRRASGAGAGFGLLPARVLAR